MASTAHKDPAQIVEHFEPPEAVEKKAIKIAKLIQGSKHFIIFTGAGISTSAGIPDFRGPEGVWTLQEQGKARTRPYTSTLKAIPTPSHMSILALQQTGLCKFLVSQNTDGLHRKSGVNPSNLAELHGNSNLEICEKCHRQYLRDFGVRTASSVHDHHTGRFCAVEGCKGKLHDSIINFGESLPAKPISDAFAHANAADLCLVLGSSLTVTPAANIPEIVGKKAKLVICNLQITPLDPLATERVFAKTDDLMVFVMKHLNIPIPEWRLNRRVLIGNSYETAKNKLYFQGVDVDGIPASFMKSVTVSLKGKEANLPSEPFQLSFRLPDTSPQQMTAKTKLSFMGHYLEPDYEFTHSFSVNQTSKTLYHLQYNPYKRTWAISKKDDLQKTSQKM